MPRRMKRLRAGITLHANLHNPSALPALQFALVKTRLTCSIRAKGTARMMDYPNLSHAEGIIVGRVGLASYEIFRSVICFLRKQGCYASGPREDGFLGGTYLG